MPRTLLYDSPENKNRMMTLRRQLPDEMKERHDRELIECRMRQLAEGEAWRGEPRGSPRRVALDRRDDRPDRLARARPRVGREPGNRPPLVARPGIRSVTGTPRKSRARRVDGTTATYSPIMRRSRRRHRRNAIAKAVIEGTRRFWQRVVDNDPPDPDGSEATMLALRALYLEVTSGKSIELPPSYSSLLALRPTLAEQKRETEKDIDAIKTSLMAAMGSAEVALLDGEKVATWKKTKAGTRTFRFTDRKDNA